MATQNIYKGNMKAYNSTDKYGQGYPTTTSYNSSGSLRYNGYPSSTSGSAGLTGYTPGYNGYTATPTTKTATTSTKSTAKKSTSSKSTGSTKAVASSTPVASSSGILMGETSAPASTFDAAAAYRSLLDAYKSRQGDYESYLNEMNNVAQGAYDRGMSSLNDTYTNLMNLLSGTYDSQRNTLEANLNRAKNSLSDSYNRSRNNVSSNAENSLKQAYINNMLSKRNIAQQMSSMGLNGGMTETTLAGLANNYGNQRNDINKTLNTNLSDIEGKYNSGLSELEGNYSSSLADALASYNNAVANAQAQKLAQIIELENALTSNKLNAYTNYHNMMNDYNNDYYNILKSAIANEVNLL
jgi:hypothetical protein